MSKKHPYIALAQVHPGAILAEDLLDKVGHVLLPAGTELTASMLKAIANHHIHQLPIQSVDTDPSSLASSEHVSANREHQLERLNQLFRHSPQDGPTATLKMYLEKYRQEEAS